MADRGYREHGRDYDRGYERSPERRDRESSIFTDDNDRWRGREGGGRWSAEYGRGRETGGDERGFFDRAGDEVRSWFGDDEAEHRRERDARRDEAREAFGGGDYDRQYGERSGWSDRNRDREAWGGGDFRGRGGQGERNGWSGFGGARGDVGRNNHWDDNYRRWRDRQIEQLDREYDEYCRHRQQRFESDFGAWRQNRETGESRSGARERGSASATTRTTGSQGAGATTTGGGRSSATEASTGSGKEKKETSGASSSATGGKSRSRSNS